MAIGIGGAILGGAAIGAGASLLGGAMSSKSAQKAASEQADYQREFAKYGIRWRVADAKAAGLHPLAALGAQTTSYQPVRTGSGIMGKSIAQAGQQIGRGISSYGIAKERQLTELQLEDAALDVEYKHLRNDAALMSNMGQATAGPQLQRSVDSMSGAPTGQGVDVIEDLETAARGHGMTASPGKPGEFFADIPSSTYRRAKVATLTQQLTESMEENLAFKAPYYGIKLKEYFNIFKASYGGDQSTAHRRFMEFWNRYLPKASPGYKWTYSKLGFFYEIPVGKSRPGVTKRLYDAYRLDPTTGPYVGP